MALKVLLEQEKAFRTIVLLLAYLACEVICETGDCRQQEFRDRSGNCVLCKQCGPGMELSKECGFGYGEDAQCMTCRPQRFKEDWGFQKCKPCLECAAVNRFQKANCSVTSDTVCGDCLPGFYRKTKLVGFQDMECVPCGDPPPPYEPHCTSKVNLVKIPSTASSPRDTALAAVICSALATVLLALLILCVIYCKRQFMEKKPSWSLRAQDIQYNGSELSCFDRRRLNESVPRACCRCHRDSAQTCDTQVQQGRPCPRSSGPFQGPSVVSFQTPGLWCRIPFVVMTSLFVTHILNSPEKKLILSVQRTKAHHLWIQTVARIWLVELFQSILKTLWKLLISLDITAPRQNQCWLRIHWLPEASYGRRVVTSLTWPLRHPCRKLKGVASFCRWSIWMEPTGHSPLRLGLWTEHSLDPAWLLGEKKINLNQTDGVLSLSTSCFWARPAVSWNLKQ